MSNQIKLTDAKLKAVKAPLRGRVELADSDCVGLRFVKGSTGKCRWIVRKRVAGKFRKITLGDYPGIGLAKARQKALQACADIESGRKVAKPDKRSNKTVSALWNTYDQQRVENKRSAKEIKRIFNKYVLPELGGRPVDTITRTDVTRLIDGIAYGERPAPVMARLVAAQMSVFFNWVLPRVETLAYNPVPASSAKNSNAVIIPLSVEACHVISGCPVTDGSSKLFPSATNPKTSASGISKLLRRLRADIQSDLQRPVLHWTLHDIRRTVATNLQRLGVRLEVTEAILNHISGSQAGIVKVYQRYNWMDEKREALQLWSDDLVRICDCSTQ